MAIIVKQISVDVASENVFKGIVAKQYDSDSRFLKVQLTNEGEPIVVKPTSTVLINARREDDAAKAFAGTVSEDGTITVPLAYWMLELDGKVECDISVIDSDKRRLTSTSFVINVEPAAYGGDDISKDEDYDVLMELMLECERATNAAERVGITTTEALETAYANILKGRNRLHKTNQGTTNWSFHSFYNESDHTLEAVTTEDGTHAVKLTIRSTSEEWSVLAYSLRDTLDKLEPNTKYTLSFDMQTNVAHSYYINICTVGSLGQLVTETFYGVPVGKQGWEHFVWHLTTNDLAALNEDYADDIILYFGVREGTGYRTIKNLKLEKGSTDTEWCKSPEDCVNGTALTEITAAAFDVMEQSVLDNREEWITIADTTLTKDVESVEVWLNDDNGNLIDFKKVRAFIKINGEFNQTGYTTWVSFMPNITTYEGACRLPASTVLNGTDKCVYAEAEIKIKGVCEGYSSFSSPVNSIQVIRRVSEMPSIKTFRFNLNNGILIPTGTTIIVEGIKA